MRNVYEIDKEYSIIYHNENSVEFRKGVWNVVSHHLSDDTEGGILAKLILEIEDNKFTDVESIANKTGLKNSECAQVIATLDQHNILVNSSNEPRDSEKQTNIIVIGCERMFNICKPNHANHTFNFLPESNLSFIMESGEDLFRDSLLLEKTIERCNDLLHGSLVVVMRNTPNPVFDLFLNKVLYEAKIPWFFSAMDGPFLYVGPMFSSDFCFECLDHRILMNAKNSSSYSNYKKAFVQKKITHAIAEENSAEKNLLCSLTSYEINNILRSGKGIGSHKLLSIFLPTLEFAYHKILRFPGCRVCGVDHAFDGHQLHFDTGALLEQ